LEVEQQIDGEVVADNQRLFDEMLELNSEIISLHKKWFYLKGIQDGIQLLMFLLFDDESMKIGSEFWE